MGKKHKKHSKKDGASDDILDVAAASIKKFRKVTKEISKLSTGQKVVGSIALAAAGFVYLAVQQDEDHREKSDDEPCEPDPDAHLPALPRRTRKSPKASSA